MTIEPPKPGDIVTIAEQVDLPNRSLYRVLHIATLLLRTEASAVVVYQAVRPATGRVYVGPLDRFWSHYAPVPNAETPDAC